MQSLISCGLCHVLNVVTQGSLCMYPLAGVGRYLKLGTPLLGSAANMHHNTHAQQTRHTCAAEVPSSQVQHIMPLMMS